MSKDTDYALVLAEDTSHKLDIILEYLQSLQTLPQQVALLQDDMQRVKDDTHVIKAAFTDQTYILDRHEKRITHLETQPN